VVTREGEDDGEERRRDGQSGTGTAEVSGASAVAPGRQAEAEGDEAQREEEGDDDGEERRVDSHRRPWHGGRAPLQLQMAYVSRGPVDQFTRLTFI